MVSVLIAALDVTWLPNVACMKISKSNRKYRRYRGIVDEDGDFLGEV